MIEVVVQGSIVVVGGFEVIEEVEYYFVYWQVVDYLYLVVEEVYVVLYVVFFDVQGDYVVQVVFGYQDGGVVDWFVYFLD